MTTVLPQFLRYGMCGAIAVLVHLAVLMILVEGFGSSPDLSTAVGFACSIPVNYLLQRNVVFRNSGNHMRLVIKYLLVTFASMGLNSLLFYAFTVSMGLYYVYAQILTLGFVVILNFLLNRQFTFAGQSAGEASTVRRRPQGSPAPLTPRS